MPKPGRWRNDPLRREKWKRNQRKDAKLHEQHSGPKYTGYFYAYSDRMLAQAVSKPVNDAYMLDGSIGEEFIRFGELVQIELPLVGGDNCARYGLLFIPSYRRDVLREIGAPYQKRKLGPRTMHSKDADIAVLADRWLPPGWSGRDLANEFDGLDVLAYREPFSARPLAEYLKQDRFRQMFRVEYGLKLLAGPKVSREAVEQSKKPLHFRFYSIPLVRGPVIDVQPQPEPALIPSAEQHR